MEDGVQSSNRLNTTDENSLGVDLETDSPNDRHPNDLETGFMVPANKETDSPNDLETGLQQQEVTSPGGAIKSGTQKAPAATDEKKQTKEIQAEGKIKLEFATFALLFGFSEILCIMFLPKNSANENILKAVSILGSMALGAGFCLLIHTFFMHAPNNTITHPIHHTISTILTIFSSTALLTSLIPLLQLPSPYNLLIPTVMGAVILTLGIHLYIIFKTNDKETDQKDKIQYENKMKEIPRLSELSQGVVSLSSGGLIGVLFGIHTNAANHADHPVVSASVFLSFACFIISICLMALCQMKLMHFSFSTIKVFLGLCKFLLVLLAFSALTIAFTFLKWYTVLVFVPVFIVFSVWLFKLWATHNIQDALEEDDLKLAYTKGNKVSSISFGGITAIFSGYLGSVEKNTHLNICMMFLVSAFLSGQSLIVLSYKPYAISHIGFAVNILAYFAISLLVFGVFAIFILEFMRL